MTVWLLFNAIVLLEILEHGTVNTMLLTSMQNDLLKRSTYVHVLRAYSEITDEQAEKHLNDAQQKIIRRRG